MGYSGSPDEVRVVVAAEVDRAIAAMRALGGATRTSTAGMAENFDEVNVASEKVQKKIEHLSVAVGFSIGAMASSTGSGTERVLHAVTGLGFALGPAIGGITLAISSIGLAMEESRKKVEEENKKSADSFVTLEQKLKGVARDIRIAALEVRKTQLEGDLQKAPIESSGFHIGARADLEDAIGLIDQRLAKLHELEAVDARDAQIKHTAKEEEIDLQQRVKAFLDGVQKARDKQLETLKASKRELADMVDAELKGVTANTEWNERAAAGLQLDKDIAATVALVARQIAAMKLPQPLTDAQKKMKSDWEDLFNSIPNLAERAFRDVIQSGESMKAFWRFMLQEMGAATVQWAYKEVASWAAKELAKKGITRAAVLERVAMESWAAVQSIGIAMWEGIKWIAIQAAKAAAAAWAALAKIDPLVLAPTVAFATLAAVTALGSGIKSAAGGYDIPAGVNPLTQLHAQEMVLPKEHADAIRRMTGGGGDTYNIYAMDSRSFEEFAMRNKGTVARAAGAGVKSGAVSGGIGRSAHHV